MEAINKQPADLSADGQTKALAQALYSQALRREMKDGFAETLPQYLNILKVDPHFIDLQIKIAFYYFRDHDKEKALSLLQKAVESNPQSGQILAMMAFVQQSTGHIDQAILNARQALVLEPDSVLGHRVLFESLRDLNRLPEALAMAKTLPQIKCDNPKILGELARAYTELICASTEISKEELSALITPVYNKAFSMGDPSADLLLQRGDFENFLGQNEEALQYLEQASQRGDPNAELYVRVASLCAQLGKDKEAIKNYELAYEISPELPLLRENLAEEYVKDNQEDKAIRVVEAILQKSPTDAKVYSALGDLYLKAKKADKAEINFRQSISIDPTDYEQYLRLASLFLSQKRYNEAASTLTEARNRFPSNARVAFYSAIVQREMKNSQQALDLFARAKILADEKEKDFPYADYYCELSLAQEEAGKPQQSEATLEQGLNEEPNNENLLNALAYLWAEQGKNLPKALKYSKRSLQVLPEKAEFLDTLGWIYYKMGKYRDALPLLEKAVTNIDEYQEEVLEHLAEVYWKMGQTKEALAALDKILAKTPDNPAIREKYDKIKKSASVAQSQATPARD